jgi:hypothetical protein
MKIEILDLDYEIEFIDKEHDNLKKILKNIKEMKSIICKRDNNEIEKDFIIKQINRFRNENEYFIFIANQKVKIYDHQTIRPTAVLFARYSSKNNSFILSLLCKYEKATKNLGTILLNELIKKAINENITSIYLESVIGSITFYKSKGFIEDDDKDEFTDSEKDILLEGYVLHVKPNNDNLIGGGIIDLDSLNFIKDNYKFIIYMNSIYCDVNVYNNNVLISSIHTIIDMHPIYGYISLLIKTIIGNNDESKKIAINVIDNISNKYYLNKSSCLTDDKELIKLLLDMNYEYKNGSHPDGKRYEKVHNLGYIIDRTILNY